MRRIGIVLILAGVAAMSLTSGAHAANRVTIQSKTFDLNSDGDTVGILIENDEPISSIVIPLELRSVTGGAFTEAPFTNTTFRWEEVPGSRMALSPLGAAADPDGLWPAAGLVRNRYATPHPLDSAQCGSAGKTVFSYTTGTPPQGDGISPDGLLYVTYSTGNPDNGEEIYLQPGADVTPSIRIVFPVNSSQGYFEIDTCCIRPSNHLAFVNASVAFIAPIFVKGRIDVGVNAVKELETGNIPNDYALEQNYPNPFNAGTVIRFAQPVDGNVSIDVYNVLGRKVRTLVNEFRSAGIHQTDWDGRSDDGQIVSTGVYFYRIVADKFTTTRKMIMLK